MKQVNDIAYNVAKAINSDSAVETFSVGNFKQGISVFMDWLGTAEFEDEEEDIFPYAVVQGQTESGGDGTNDIFDILLLVAINAEVDGEDRSKALKDDNGIYVAGRNDMLSDLCEKIVDAVKAYKCGAILKEFSTGYDNATKYPVQFALMDLKFESVNSY